jgi:thioredoxin 1
MAAGIIELTSETDFAEQVEQADQPVVVDFWAPWCGPCQMQGKVLEELTAKHGDKARVVKVNVDDVPALAQRFGVQSIPTILIFKDGAMVEQKVGLMSLEDLESKL